MSDPTNKEHAVNVSLSTLATLIIIVPAFWFLFRPIITDAVAEDMQAKVKQTVQMEVKPLNDAFSVLLARDISRLRRQIAELEYRRQTNNNWTVTDATLLSDLRIELESLQAAKVALQRAEDD